MTTKAKGSGPSRELQCIVCGGDMQAWMSALFDDRYGAPGTHDLFRCPECGQGRTVPGLTEDSLPSLYSTYYPRKDVAPEEVLLQVAAEPSSLHERFRRWMRGTYNQGQYYAGPGMRVLDYGCGAGHALVELDRMGAEAYGLETDRNVLRIAHELGLRVYVGCIEDMPFPGVQFDLITLNQVIEHSPDPCGLLKALAARLAPGAHLAVAMPNADSLYRRWFGRRWINWHVPYHLHHFTVHSAQRFFEAQGWHVLERRTVTPNLWTILQLRALAETPIEGIKTALWTGAAREKSEHQAAVSPSNRALVWLATQAPSWLRLPALVTVNRIIDWFGLGDSLLFLVRRPRRA
jgi:2-polyprenyl-3-methyl-5-hydroxy-6-metoxy-1,4-benzoquinol methylase